MILYPNAHSMHVWINATCRGAWNNDELLLLTVLWTKIWCQLGHELALHVINDSEVEQNPTKNFTSKCEQEQAGEPGTGTRHAHHTHTNTNRRQGGKRTPHNSQLQITQVPRVNWSFLSGLRLEMIFRSKEKHCVQSHTYLRSQIIAVMDQSDELPRMFASYCDANAVFCVQLLWVHVGNPILKYNWQCFAVMRCKRAQD